ncbi:MAG: hypothetical protein Q7J07_08325 [Pelolinea sp.]|nr:hypothetical protein [Pelolinea sp.]
MEKNQTFNQKAPIFIQIRKFLNIILLQSFAAAIWLLALPKEAEHAVLLGYSLKKLALLLPIFMLPIAGYLFLLLLGRNAKLQECFQKDGKREKTARSMIIGGVFVSLSIWIFAFFFHFLRWSEDIGIYLRLLPILVSYLVFGIQAIVFVPFFLFKVKRSSAKTKLDQNSPVFLIVLGTLMVLLLVIELTGLGKSPVWVSTTTLGIPLLEGQIWFLCGVIALMVLAMFAWSAVPGKTKWDSFRHKDILIFFFLWLMALMIWMSLPLPEHNYFAPSVRAPNFEKYPFSDAEQYDYNSLYVYFGSIQNFVISKPLYVSFLAILHFIGGFSYTTTIFLQTIVLAFFPSILFLIGKELHSRLGGIGIAILVILREVNAIQASTISNVSNSKLLLSDLPATLVVAIMVLVIIRWFKRSDQRVSHHVFILGGLTAVLNLMRIQTIMFIPFILLLTVMRYFKKPKKILYACAVFLLTVGTLLAPTLIRNHSITGVYWLDNPSSSSALYSFFIRGSEMDVEIPDVETSQDILDRNFSIISQSLSQNFSQLMAFILDNVFRNLISTILIFPVRLGNSLPLIEYVRVTQPFWSEVYSQPNFLNTVVVFVNIVIIALGYFTVHKRSHWSAFTAFLVYLVYNLSSAVVRLSGWRFIQPVDWIIIVFFVIGLVEIIKWAAKKIFSNDIQITKEPLVMGSIDKPGSHRNYLGNIIVGIVFVISCAFIPLREILFPPLYADIPQSEICKEIEAYIKNSEYSELTGSINTFCAAEDVRIFKGAGFYPRFFKEGEGYYDRSYDPYFGYQEYARLVFRMVGQNGKIYIKTENPDLNFENGALVYALGRIEPRPGVQLVIIATQDPQIIISTPILTGNDVFLID